MTTFGFESNLMQFVFDPVLIVNGLVTLTVVIGGVKISMNGIHKSLERLEKGQAKIEEKMDDHSLRIMVTETVCKYNHPLKE